MTSECNLCCRERLVECDPPSAAAPKVASDIGAGLRKAIKREIDGLKGADSPWAVGIRDRLRTALATDATDGATGGGEGCTCARRHDPDQLDHQSDCVFVATTPGGDLLEQAETLESIIAWGDETFGPCTAERAVSRGREELDEAEQEIPGSPQHAVEIADTIICFLRVPGILEAINAKMGINRNRTWNVGADGTGYHVKADAIRALSAQTDDGGEK